jgi:hypothetical protein
MKPYRAITSAETVIIFELGDGFRNVRFRSCAPANHRIEERPLD